MAELKVKSIKNAHCVTLSISALPPEGEFFKHLWLLGQKRITQIFERRSGYKIMKQNVSGGGLIFQCFSIICSKYP